MKKAQKEQIKAGGEIARAKYEAFMRKPLWGTIRNEDEKQETLNALHEVMQNETEVLQLLNKESAALNKKRTHPDDPRRKEHFENSRRMGDRVYALFRVIRMLEGISMDGSVPVYCRDN